jgi:hypothetical protein
MSATIAAATATPSTFARRIVRRRLAPDRRFGRAIRPNILTTATVLLIES